MRNSVFTGDPFRSVIESCKRKLVLYLLKFGIGEGFAVKLLLISALKYLPDVVPELVFVVQVRAVCPLAFALGKLGY